ncbi:MAG: polyprenol monophosphomannose synthase [Actinomycetota bacterium]
MKTLVVLPTYNESLNIDRMLKVLRSTVPEAQILVVDDGSPDGTAEMALSANRELGAIEVLRRTGKQGLGSAYRAGFSWGLEREFDAFVEIDCDFSHDPAELPIMLALAESSEVVIGSRYVPGGSIPSWSMSRLLLSRGGNKYSSWMLGLKVADATAGYRVYRKSALEKIDYTTVKSDGYGFQVEMTYRARRGGASIVEHPIAFRDRVDGESKMSSAIVLEALTMVTRWGLARRLGR